MEFRRHPLESQRLAALRSYDVLDSPDDDAFDGLTRLAARVCQAPISLISLIDTDRQWILSRYGVDDTEDPRTQSICSDAVAAGFALVIPDLTAVSRYADLPSVVRPGGFRTYAGIPLIGREGLPLGTLCVLDTHSRRFDAAQLAALHDLAEQVVLVLEHRRTAAALQLTQAGQFPDPSIVGANEPAQPVDLRRAWDDHELVPRFQAWVDLRSAELYSVEAQVRWRHRSGVLLPAGTVLPGQEDGDLAVPLASALLDAACAVLVDLRSRGIDLRGGVGVPIGVGELVRPGLARRVLGRLEEHHLPREVLTLEITDTGSAGDRSLIRRELLTLRDGGVRVTADSFGAGWQNLVRLLQLPLSGIKLDHRLVTGMLGNEEQDQMVAAAVNLGIAMNLRVGSQGVDSAAIRGRLLLHGCRFGQGSLFGEPVLAGGVPALFLGLAVRRPQLLPG